MIMKIRRSYKITTQTAFMKLKDFWVNSILFVLLSAFNGLIPICVCLIAAKFNPFGTQLTMAIGYITAIQLGFTQLSWTVSLAAIFAHSRYQKNNIDNKQMEVNLVSTTMALSLIYGLIITPLFLGVSFAYNNYASGHINTLLGQAQANNYIFAISGYILFSGFIFSGIIFVQKYSSSFKAIQLLCLFSGLSLAISAGLTLGTQSQFTFLNASNALEIKPGNYQGLFLGLGFTISSIVMLPIVYFAVVKCTNFKLKDIFKNNNLSYFLKRTYSPLLLILTIQLIKGIVIIAIGLSLKNSVEQVVPTSYQLARNIWYNLLYLLPFFAYGLADATLYYGSDLQYTNKADFRKIAIITTSLVIIVQIPFIAGIYYAIEPLSAFYLQNNLYNGSSWAMDTSKVSLKYTIETLLKKQEYVDKIKQLSNTQAIVQFLTSLGIVNQQQATVIAPLILPFLQGLTNDNPMIREQSIDGIVKLVQTLKLEGQLQLKIATFLESGKAASIFKMFDVSQKSYAYIYIAVWSMTYPIGQIFNYATISMKGQFNSPIKTFLVFLLQGAIISFIVAFGIKMQYSKEFPMYDAWSLPLVIFGPISIAYFYTNFLKELRK